MGYRKDLAEKQVEGTYQSIEILNEKFVFQKKLDLIFEEIMDLNSIYNFRLKGMDGTEYFRCNYYSFGIDVFDIYNYPLCSINKDLNIVTTNRGKKTLATIIRKDSTQGNKYSIEVNSLKSSQKEKFDINCDINYRVCGIFHGKEKSGAPMVCKIVKSYYYSNYYKIDIAPGIDTGFITMLICFFMGKCIKHRDSDDLSVITKNYIAEVTNKPVEKPLREIPIINSEYLSKMPLVYRIEGTKLNEQIKGASESYTIYGPNNEKVYYAKEKMIKFILYNKKDEPIINLSVSSKEKIKRRIFLGKGNEKCIGNLSKRFSSVHRKYELEFLNLDTGIFDKFIMNCDKDLYFCNILYDNKQGNVSLVGKIIKNQYEKRQFHVEIAPAVDSAFIIMACVYFADKSCYYLNDREDKSNSIYPALGIL